MDLYCIWYTFTIIHTTINNTDSQYSATNDIEMYWNVMENMKF